jgi:hypothetical protein
MKSAQRLHVVGQRATRAPQSLRQPVDLPHAPVDPIEARAEVERRARLLTMAEAAAKLHYQSGDAAYRFLRRHAIKLSRRGTIVLVREGDIDRFFETGSSDLVARARAQRGQ